MKKFADRYLEVQDWGLAESGFHPERGRVSESLFALANEHMGVRAYFEEGYSGDRLVGSYLNGVYEELRTQKSYKGVSDRVCFMVNSVDWLYLRLRLDGETLDLAVSAHEDFRRSLDFRTGLLTRSFVWKTAGGKQLRLCFERLLSMDLPEVGRQRLTLTALDFAGPVELEAGLDFSPPHEVYGRNYWTCPEGRAVDHGALLGGQSTGLGQQVLARFELRGPGADDATFVRDAKYAGRVMRLTLARGVPSVVEKLSAVVAGRPGDAASDLENRAADRLSAALRQDFDTVLAANRSYWDRVWEVSDITIEGDPLNQQGIRFCVFQLEQTFRGRNPAANIGAKGLSGEFYNGNYFWDTEVYCFPYYLFKDVSKARALLDYRYRTLPQAMDRARQLDCRGACYPVATIDGSESCTLWQHASLQFQPTTSVVHAIRHYELVSADSGFMAEAGLEMLIQTARFLASRVQWSKTLQAYGYYCVMGPDEFQMMVNHNAYTNYMGKRSLEYAAASLDRMRRERPAEAARIEAKTGLGPEEPAEWTTIASLMHMPRDPGKLLFEQHAGYFDLPHVDIASIPAEEFPLYHSWSYDRIYRNDMIKQPDVLMFLFLYNRSFSREEKLANYEFYEPRCIHESSLSPSIHSILAAELGKHEEACRFFGFATRVDLDDYNRNTREGLHMTAIAAAWMNIVYGFGGLRSDGDRISLAPSLPAAWTGFSFRLRIGANLVSLAVTRQGSELTLLSGPGLELEIGGQAVRLDPAAPRLALTEVA